MNGVKTMNENNYLDFKS